ncbi:NIPSNAP family protein [Bordetella genomosp. 13]|uniref:NIPSNAP family protein n=1 Tax=Bordetella genomosp. 13 TaxID=463040 RepID=A0A1W6ZHA6_9BORD|nr:NIPSNAP family protein [Bordetella genomosp. 13]ARP96687.1 NIPSNAP family protein [Bordetella genomosp. 13]
MLYDVRTYTCSPGKIKKHLALYAEHGYDVQRRHLGEPLAYMQTETGDVNSYMHIWAYADAADRARRRAALQADPEWAQYLARSSEAGYLIAQRNQLMTSVPFFAPQA